MTFNDMCHLQTYFDQRNASHPRAFRVLEESTSEAELAVPSEDQEGAQSRRVTRGEGQYQVSDRPARVRLQQLLDEEYSNVPDVGLRLPNARIKIRVSWYLTSGQIRRLLPDNNIELQGPGGTTSIPFNPCIGEFLFGAEVYQGRRRFLDDSAARAAGRDAPSVLEEQARLRALEAQITSDSGAPSTTDAQAP